MRNRRERREDASSRASMPDHMHSYCRVIGCPNPARAGTTDGLDRKFCRSHADHYQRHGSPYRGSFTAAEIDPFRRQALDWLAENRKDPFVDNAITRVDGLYRRAGSHVEAFRLRGLSPADRAKAAWARLRECCVDPVRVIAAWLAVDMAIAADPQIRDDPEYRRVQAAKLVHRMASGTHKRWTREEPDPNRPGRRRTTTTEMHVYPRSRGRVLRHIGRDLEGTVEMLPERQVGSRR